MLNDIFAEKKIFNETNKLNNASDVQLHKLISAFAQRMHKCVITKSREFYCRPQVSVWVTQPAAAVIFDHNVTALQLSCNGPLVTEQLWLCGNRGSDITIAPTATGERGEKHKRSSSNWWREIKASKQIKTQERMKKVWLCCAISTYLLTLSWSFRCRSRRICWISGSTSDWNSNIT